MTYENDDRYVDLLLCRDCTVAECNSDYSGMNDDRAEEVAEATEALHEQFVLVTLNDDAEVRPEFDVNECDCCGERLWSERTVFAGWTVDPTQR